MGGFDAAGNRRRATPGVLARRERDKWDFAPPGGESYREVAGACRRLVRDA